MGSRFARFFGVTLAGTLAMPACGGSDGARKARESDGGDASPSGGGSAGRGGTTGATGGSGGSAGAADGGTTSSGGSTPLPEAGADAAIEAGAEVSVDASMDAPLDVAEEAATCMPSDADGTPPTLLSAALIGPDEVRLTFSESVAPPAGVDPSKFRLSFGEATNAEGAYTYYSALSNFGSGEPSDYAFESLEGDCSAEILARAVAPLPLSSICQEIDERTGTFTTAIGLFLHFRAAETPTIEDPSGNQLAGIAEDWASPGLVDGAAVGALPDSRRVTGELPLGPVPVAVDCGSDAGADGGGLDSGP